MVDAQSDHLSEQFSSSLKDIRECSTVADLEAVRVAWLGRKGHLPREFANLRDCAPEDRSARGEFLNTLKQALQDQFATRRDELKAEAVETLLKSKHDDLSLPPHGVQRGSLHVLPQTIDEVIAIFGSMGFSLEEGPDIDDDFHNFTALNFPPYHPARDTQDTFFLDHKDAAPFPGFLKQNPDNRQAGNRQNSACHDTLMLRTHTSTVQVRTMLTQPLPIRIIAPGRCYRRDSDITHSPMFHQVEGLYVDKKVNFRHLKYTLATFLRIYFDSPKIPLRFRPGFFPFVEPGAEIDIACERSDNQLRVGTGSDWLEILGCGMVHPNVFRACGIDPEVYSGFAFGIGLERIAMLKHGIADLRSFFGASLPWLRHYGFSPFYQPDMVVGLTP